MTKRFGVIAKVSQQFKTDKPDEYKKFVTKLGHKNSNKGVYFRLRSLQTGFAENDFIMGLESIVVTFDLIKIPRILNVHKQLTRGNQGQSDSEHFKRKPGPAAR